MASIEEIIPFIYLPIIGILSKLLQLRSYIFVYSSYPLNFDFILFQNELFPT